MFSIKRVTSQEELDAILNVRREVFVLGMGISEEVEVDEYDTFPSPLHHYAIMDDGVIVGTLRAFPEGNNTVRFQRFAILSSERGKGFGRKALEAMFEIYKGNYTYFHAMKSAEGFYKSCGYTSKGDYFDEEGIPHIEMFKIL